MSRATTRLPSASTDVVFAERPAPASLSPHVWQWGFGGLAPLALIVIDLRLFGGWLLSMAPAAFWTIAILAPLILALSGKRWSRPLDFMLSGAVVSAALIAFIAAILPVLVYLVRAGIEAVTGADEAKFMLGLGLISALSLLFTWPLYFCASAFRRQAKLRLKRRKDYKASSTVIGMLLLPVLLIAIEAGDRFYFGSMVAKLQSKDVSVVLEGAGQLQAYPLAMMTRTEAVCAPLYAQHPDSFVSADSLENQLGWAWGRDAQKVRAAARKLFGANAARTCAEALSSD